MLVQTLTPNPTVACKPGWCLKYVSDAFDLKSVPHKIHPTAIAAWNASEQHRDLAFPAGRWVPLWFTLANEPAGHVAILAPDGAVWSSSHPTSTTPIRHPSLGGLLNYYALANPLTYLGWSPDIGGTRVITNDGDFDMIADTNHEYARWEKLAYHIRGRQFSRDEFRSAAVGKTWLSAIEILSDHPEAETANHAQEIGQVAMRDNWQDQIAGLKKQLAEKDAAIAKAAADTAAALAAQAAQMEAQTPAKTTINASHLDDPFNVPGRGAVSTPAPTIPSTPTAPPEAPKAPQQNPLFRVLFGLILKLMNVKKKA